MGIETLSSQSNTVTGLYPSGTKTGQNGFGVEQSGMPVSLKTDGDKFCMTKDKVKVIGISAALTGGAANGVITGGLAFLVDDLICKSPFEKVVKNSVYTGLAGFVVGTAIFLYNFNKSFKQGLNKE